MSSQFYRSASMSRTLPDINCHRPLSAMNHVKFSTDFDQFNRRPTLQGSYDAFQGREHYADNDQWLDKNRSESFKRSHYDYQKSFDSSINPTLTSEHPSQVKELLCRLEEKENEVWKTRGEVETARKRELQLQAAIQRLQRQVVMLESEQTNGRKDEYLNEAYKNVQADSKELQNRVIELEERLRMHLEEKERSEQDRMGSERRLRELTRCLSSLLYLEGNIGASGSSITSLSSSCNGDKAVDEIIRRVEEVMQDNALLKGVQVKLKDQLARMEVQDVENKETIMRLSGEIEKQQQLISKCSVDVEAMKVERDRSLMGKEEQEREMLKLRERLDTVHKSWEQLKGEVEEGRGCRRLVETERIREGIIGDSDAHRLKAFKENLCKMLAADEMFERREIVAREEEIVNALNSLVVQKHDYKAAMENNWKLLEDLTSLTDDLCEKLKNEPYQNRDALFDIQNTLERIKKVKSRQNVSYGGFDTSDRKLRSFLERLGSSLMLPAWRSGVEVEQMVEEVVVCVKRLMEKSGDVTDEDKNRHILSLQRKVKSLKEQAGKKDRQIDLLKDNISDNDQEGTVERYRMELNEAHLEIRQLRKKLYDLTTLKSEMKEGREILRTLEHEVEDNKREKREKQSTIQQLELRSQQLRKQLNNTRIALERINSQYKKLAELKSVLSNMLGIPAGSNAHVDFEILSRIEQLILTSSNQTANCLLIDPGRSVSMAQKYKRNQLNNSTKRAAFSGHFYNGASNDGYRTDGYSPNEAPYPNRYGRSRSFSPKKKFDTRVF